jgi:hypothetical protein
LVAVPVLQVSGALSHSVLARAGLRSAAPAEVVLAAVLAAELPAVLALAAAPPLVVGELLLLLEPLQADIDRTTVRAATAPVPMRRFIVHLSKITPGPDGPRACRTSHATWRDRRAFWAWRLRPLDRPPAELPWLADGRAVLQPQQEQV